MSTSKDRVFMNVHPEVRSALEHGKPVVALETAVVTHGLPATPLPVPECLTADSPLQNMLATPLRWDDTVNTNLQLALLMSQAVRNAGAVPASIGMLDGVLHIGMDDEQLTALAESTNAKKASIRDLAPLLLKKADAGTTVAASLRCCSMCEPKPIQVFATGGIGGVHRDWQTRPDISADLKALAEEPVAVVASGAKVILDLPATYEALDALGVPIIGHTTDGMPRFTAPPSEKMPVPHRCDDPEEIATMCRTHWHNVGSRSSVLIANPCPAGLECDTDQIDLLVDAGLAEAAALGIEGGEVTPFLLGKMGSDPTAATISANIALLLSNATVASKISVALAH